MDNLVILNFAEAKQPEYKEKKGQGYIEFGYKNDYPNYLLSLYNKSAKHNAIVRGKVNYIIGNGWSSKEQDQIAELFINSPNPYENLNDLSRKVSIDIELFGGAYIEVIWGKIGGMIAEICHIDYTKIRSNKDNTQFWYKQDWQDRKIEPDVIPAFNTQNRIGKQILYIKEYRPSLDTYALPNYMGALNYIESDIEVSKHVLGNAQTGFSASKLITLPNGEPSPDEKGNIERRFTDRFSGSDGKKFILSFVQDAARKPIIDDLGASDLTKEDFGRVDSMIQQNIFAGHQITSPSLFGIAEPGKLGTRTELRDAYEVFKNTYVNDKQKFLESIFNQLAVLRGVTEELYIQPVEPISFEFSEATISANMTKDEIREKMSLPPLEVESAGGAAQMILDSINSLSPLVATKVLDSMSVDEIRGLVGLQKPVTPTNPDGTPVTPEPTQQMVNEHLKGMKGREWQNFQRIIREFNKGKITREQAVSMLKQGYGLDDDSINTWLGSDIEEQQFESHDEIKSIALEFGQKKSDYIILKSKDKFNADNLGDFEMQFAQEVITDALDKNILKVISENKNANPKDIAKALKKTEDEILERINVLQDLEIIKYDTKKNTTELKKPLSEVIDKPVQKTYLIRYSYEWRVPKSQQKEQTSRPFCKALMDLNDYLWSRADIERMSARLGFSVFDRGGGWWTMPNGEHSPQCRHKWVANIVVKK